MRRANKITLTMGSAALIAAGAVSAAAPVAYEQWQAAQVNGQTEIQTLGGAPLANPANCPTGFTCGSAVFGDGFLQRAITDTASGAQYFQTIITDKNVAGLPGTLGFYDESYVRSGVGSSQNVPGIAGKQRVTDLGITQANTNVITSNELNIGWASSPNTPTLNISQTVRQTNVGFSTGFSLVDLPTTGTPRSGTNGELRTITLDQSVALSPDQQGNSTENQVFALRQLDAPANGSLTLPGATPVAYTAGQAIQAIWLGQDMPSTGQVFGFEGYSNVTAGGTISSFTLAAPVTPQNWPTAVFGAAPTF